MFFLLVGLGQSRRGPYGAGVTPAAEFDCPEEFGYYPHPTDCTQYYVCVFGGALLESCTGGLMYRYVAKLVLPTDAGGGELTLLSFLRILNQFK